MASFYLINAVLFNLNFAIVCIVTIVSYLATFYFLKWVQDKLKNFEFWNAEYRGDTKEIVFVLFTLLTILTTYVGDILFFQEEFLGFSRTWNWVILWGVVITFGIRIAQISFLFLLNMIFDPDIK